MAAPSAVGSFPSPYEIETPPGCEGWEDMYPYYARFDEERRAEDEQRFWFWNSMHFPVPMPAFDAICVDSPYQAIGNWQNRVFAVPPAMGIDWRCINGYIYISGNPVLDPAKIGERAGYFQARAGYYYANWDELYGKWRVKMDALIAELGELQVPELGEYEPDAVAFEDDETSYCAVIQAYRHALRLLDLMWQHHFEFLLLGYGAYMTFAELCKANLPDIPDQHIAQMVAGLDVLLFRPDQELRRLARLAIDTGVDGAFVEGRSPEEIDAELAQSDAGRAWLAELEQVKEPWFHMATGDGLYHTYTSWLDDPRIPYASLIGHIGALNAGVDIERPAAHIAETREKLATEYAALLNDDARKGFDELLALSRTVFPYVEEHKFICDYWFLTEWWNKIREFGDLFVAHGFFEHRDDIFQLTRLEVYEALDELALTWATGGPARGPKYWPPIVARRKEILERLGEWTPPPAVGAVPEEMLDPALIMLWGVDDAARARVGARAGGRPGADRGGRVARHRRGPRARREDGRRDRRRPRRRDPRLQHHVAGVGADLLQDPRGRDRHRRRHVARRDRLPRVRAAGGRRDGPRDLVDQDGADDPRRRDGGNGDDPRVSDGGHTRTLAELRHGDSGAFGGKSSTLGELIAGGIPVPPGFAVSTSAFRAFVDEAGLGGMIAAEMSRMSPADVESVGAASHAISQAMRSAPIPDAVRDEVVRRYAELGEPPVAVRSSALGEDSQDATFAGQQETYLWVRGADHVCDAVRDCWVSLYSPPAISYRARLSDGEEPAMGVAVQLMVDAEVSGVLFTCNPVSGDPSMVAVNASWGLGLAVVGGEVTPDDFLVSKVTREVVREHVHAKDVEYVPDPAGRGAVRREVPAERREVACLDAAALEALVEIAGRIERYFGSHQDVEWAIARDGELFVVQSRPVTAVHKPAGTPAASAMALVMSAFGVGEKKD